MSIALGNNKPEQLLEVEKLIWEALFTLSGGTKAVEDVLTELLIQIPWQKLQPPILMLPQQEWFTIQAIPVSAAPAQNTLPVPESTPAAPDNNAMDVSTAVGVTTPAQNTVPVPMSTLAVPAAQSTLPVPASTQVVSATPNTLPVPASTQAVHDNNSINVSTAASVTTPTQTTLPTQATFRVLDAASSLFPDSPPSCNNLMDESLDYQLEPLPRTFDPRFEGFRAMNEDSPSDDPTLFGPLHDEENELPESGIEPGLTTASSRASSEQSLEATGITYRRSTRLAMEKPEEATKETAEDKAPKPRTGTKRNVKSPVNPECSASPDASLLQERNHQPLTAALKRAFTGNAEVENLLSGGASPTRPIDVDALHAVLERYPVKLEPQVCPRILNCNMTVIEC